VGKVENISPASREGRIETFFAPGCHINRRFLSEVSNGKEKKWVIVTVLVGLEVLVCAGMILAARGIPWHFFYVADALAEEVFEQTFTVSTLAYLEVEVVTSNIEIARGTSPGVVVKAIKQVWGRKMHPEQSM
jgi:hypothetical protein